MVVHQKEGDLGDCHDKPMPLGSRALGILIALLERHGELVSKQDLMALVWTNVLRAAAPLPASETVTRLII
jgi:DNA-binding winged helix-turn-helix (wHTH) protein